jgi:DNA-binding SARP family transcriptional activator/streptogramin lyase
MDVRLLGPFEVWEGDRRLSIGGGKQLALLVLLVLNRNEVLSSDRIVDALWDGRPPPTASKNVQIYVSQLRKVLGEDAIVTRSGGYSLDLPPDAVDVARFEESLARGRELLASGDNAAAAATVRKGLSLWRGSPLADVAYADFAQAEINRLEELHNSAVEERNQADLELGRHAELVPELESLVREHPFRERLRAQLMLALYRCGRQADALAAFRTARQTLVDELGLEPGRSLQELEREILAHDPRLDAPKRSMAVRVPRKRGLVVGALVTAAAVAAAAVAFRSETRPVQVALNAVGVIDPDTNKVIAQVPVGVNPSGIAVENGRVWVANEEDRTLSEIDAGSRKPIRTIALDGAATGVTAADGFVWVLNAATPENTTPPVEITKINPRLGQVVDRIPTDLAYGEVIEGQFAVDGDDGSAWVPSAVGDSTTQAIERIHLGDHQVVGRVRVFGPRRAADGITYGEGAVWFVDARGLVRFDPKTGNPDVAAVHGGGGVAVGLGAVWVGARFPPECLLLECKSKPGYVARVDLGGGAVEATTPAGDPVSVAVGAGSVWVANRQSRTVQRIDPATNRTIATIRLHNPPVAIAVGDGAIWVVVG